PGQGVACVRLVRDRILALARQREGLLGQFLSVLGRQFLTHAEWSTRRFDPKTSCQFQDGLRDRQITFDGSMPGGKDNAVHGPGGSAPPPNSAEGSSGRP